MKVFLDANILRCDSVLVIYGQQVKNVLVFSPKLLAEEMVVRGFIEEE